MIYFFLIKFHLSINCINTNNFLETLRGYTNINEENFLINNCYFSRQTQYIGNGENNHSISNLNNNYFGGIIYIYGINSNLTIIETIFYNCSSYGSGGAIYFDCEFANSNVFLNKVCSNLCSSNQQGQFAYIKITSHNYNNQTYKYCSISKSSNFNNGVGSLISLCGNLNIISSNFSLNKARLIATFYTYRHTSIFVKYLTIANNIVSENTIIWLQCHGFVGILETFNIVGNISPIGVIYRAPTDINSNFILKECYFKENFNNLIFCWAANIKLIECVINHQYDIFTSTFNGAIFSESIIYEEKNTLFLTHFSTIHCLTYTPPRTYNENILSCKKIIFTGTYLITLLIIHFIF